MKSILKHSVFPERRLISLRERLDAYVNTVVSLKKKHGLYSRPETSVIVAEDVLYQRSILKQVARFGKIQHMVLIGIGGSNLGTEAVYEACKTEKSPELTVLDQIDGESLSRVSELLKSVRRVEDVVLVIVSKSGATTETILNAVKATEVFEKRFGEKVYKQMVFVGDKDTDFMNIGRRKGILTIAIPSCIGGRYSVFTAVGIVPLTILGIDTEELRRGAANALKGSRLSDAKNAAVTLALSALSGTHTVNLFTLGKRLETVGYWYRQLLAESIGKRMTTRGATFSHQLLPIVSTVVDLHSMAQLFFSGYEGLYTHFVHVKDDSPVSLLRRHWLFEHLPFLAGKRVGEVSEAIVHGVLKAYDEKKIPYRKTELQGLSPYEIGLLMNSLMLEVMSVAHLLNVDAFDQPEVELYKKHTRAVLKK